MRMMILAAVAALAFASGASAADPAGPYKLDAKGKCHAANGQFAKQGLCAPPKASNHCRDPKSGHYVKCGTSGSVPA